MLAAGMTLFYAVPAWLLLFAGIVVGAGLAVGGQLAVRRRFSSVNFTEFNEVGGIALGVVAGLFGITLAFVIGIVWQEYDATQQRVAREAGAATDLWHITRGLPPALGASVRRDLVGYARLMVDEEWPEMRHGGSSAGAEALLTRTFEAVASAKPKDAGTANAQSAALQYLGTLHDERHHRIDDNQSGVSPFQWTILLIGAIVIVALCYLISAPVLRTQLLITGAVAAMIAAMFILIYELDYPFRGDLAISPAGWQEFLDKNRAAI